MTDVRDNFSSTKYSFKGVERCESRKSKYRDIWQRISKEAVIETIDLTVYVYVGSIHDMYEGVSFNTMT